MHEPSSWYDSPLDRFSADEQRRRDGDQSTRKRVDPYVTGLVRALAAGAGRTPLFP